MVTCYLCARTMENYSGAFFRQNPKGEKGIWACEEHSDLSKIDESVISLVRIIKNERS